MIFNKNHHHHHHFDIDDNNNEEPKRNKMISFKNNRRYTLKSLEDVSHCLLVVGIQLLCIYRSGGTLLLYNSQSWQPFDKPNAELAIFALLLFVSSILLLPMFIYSCLFSLNSYANDHFRFGLDLDTEYLLQKAKKRQKRKSEKPSSLTSMFSFKHVYKNLPPIYSLLHLLMSLCILMAPVLLMAKEIEYGLRPKGYIHHTWLDFVLSRPLSRFTRDILTTNSSTNTTDMKLQIRAELLNASLFDLNQVNYEPQLSPELLNVVLALISLSVQYASCLWHVSHWYTVLLFVHSVFASILALMHLATFQILYKLERCFQVQGLRIRDKHLALPFCTGPFTVTLLCLISGTLILSSAVPLFAFGFYQYRIRFKKLKLKMQKLIDESVSTLEENNDDVIKAYKYHVFAVILVSVVCCVTVPLLYDYIYVQQLTGDRLPVWTCVVHIVFILWYVCIWMMLTTCQWLNNNNNNTNNNAVVVVDNADEQFSPLFKLIYWDFSSKLAKMGIGEKTMTMTRRTPPDNIMHNLSEMDNPDINANATAAIYCNEDDSEENEIEINQSQNPLLEDDEEEEDNEECDGGTGGRRKRRIKKNSLLLSDLLINENNCCNNNKRRRNSSSLCSLMNKQQMMMRRREEQEAANSGAANCLLYENFSNFENLRRKMMSRSSSTNLGILLQQQRQSNSLRQFNQNLLFEYQKAKLEKTENEQQQTNVIKEEEELDSVNYKQKFHFKPTAIKTTTSTIQNNNNSDYDIVVSSPSSSTNSSSESSFNFTHSNNYDNTNEIMIKQRRDKLLPNLPPPPPPVFCLNSQRTTANTMSLLHAIQRQKEQLQQRVSSGTKSTVSPNSSSGATDNEDSSSRSSTGSTSTSTQPTITTITNPLIETETDSGRHSMSDSPLLVANNKPPGTFTSKCTTLASGAAVTLMQRLKQNDENNKHLLMKKSSSFGKIVLLNKPHTMISSSSNNKEDSNRIKMSNRSLSTVRIKEDEEQDHVGIKLSHSQL